MVERQLRAPLRPAGTQLGGSASRLNANARRTLQFAFCILQFAFCIPAFAQTSSSPLIQRLPPVGEVIKTAQLPPSIFTPPATVPAPQPAAPPPASFRKIQFFPRSEGLGFSYETIAVANENVAVISGGVNVVVQGLSVENVPAALGPIGDIDIEADRVVVWGLPDGTAPSGATQQSNLPLQIYIEGNIVFRQGDRIFFADRIFYDVRQQRGLIINGELIAPIPQIGNATSNGLVRLRASAIRQLDNGHFVAQNGLVTTSRLEDPSYAFTADTIQFEDLQQPALDPITGAPAVDPATGQPIAAAHRRLAESSNNYLYLGDVPVFYWPTLATDLENPNYYISNFRFRHDSIFGYQAYLELDAFQLLGIHAPAGTRWDLDLSYLSERGFGYGTGVEYTRDSFFAIDGPTTGKFNAWFISDSGIDNLGRERRDIVPEADFRGKVFWNHRQHVAGGLFDDWVVQGEVGWLSDRTFLEEYYEQEWDNNKDQLTGVRLKHTYDNQSLSLEAYGRINDFFTQTQWLPRLDHYWLGEPLINDQLTWFEHSNLAYADIGIASTPTNPTLAAQFERLPWEEDSAGNPISGRGERFVTRQEIDYPLDLAPFKVVPFALGELYHAGDDIDGNSIDRAYVNTGVRASIPFWYADPSIHDPLFNLNGLAHKVVFDAEFSYSDASRDLNQFPLYDEIDDDSIEDLRRRLFFTPFGGTLAGTYYTPGAPSTIDPKFDPRFYALRYGLHEWVTAPSSEIADDLMAVRAGMHHRLQTKHGGPGEEHVVDWITFDANATWFPDSQRDNAGADVGLLDYDFRWFLGDRFSILSDGYADTFGDGLRTASVGMLITRPATGNFYLGFRAATGLFEADVVTAAVNYRATEKWIMSASSSVDFGPTGNIGQSFGVTRIGESLLTHVGVNANASRGTVGAQFLIEPRFLPRLNTTKQTGIEIPPVGAYGLE